MIIMCPKHGKCASTKIGKQLKKAIDQNLTIEYLVGLEYYFDFCGSDSRDGFYFSPNEAKRYNIQEPGIKITFNLKSDEEPENPYQNAVYNTTIICSKCFEEKYSILIVQLEKEYKENKYKLIEL